MPIAQSGGSNVGSSQIIDGEIMNADINNAADIRRSKLKASDFSFTQGVATKDSTEASTTQNIAHGLGRIPTRIIFLAYYQCASLTYHVTHQGSFINGNNLSLGGLHAQSSGTFMVYNSTSYAIAVADSNIPTGSGQTGVVTVDATNIIINWTKFGAPSGTYSFIWMAE